MLSCHILPATYMYLIYRFIAKCALPTTYIYIIYKWNLMQLSVCCLYNKLSIDTSFGLCCCILLLT